MTGACRFLLGRTLSSGAGSPREMDEEQRGGWSRARKSRSECRELEQPFTLLFLCTPWLSHFKDFSLLRFYQFEVGITAAVRFNGCINSLLLCGLGWGLTALSAGGPEMT